MVCGFFVGSEKKLPRKPTQPTQKPLYVCTYNVGKLPLNATQSAYLNTHQTYIKTFITV
jgi:hypothetical protein